MFVILKKSRSALTTIEFCVWWISSWPIVISVVRVTELASNKKILHMVCRNLLAGMKLIIALGDRYALGFWETDAYAIKYGLVAPGTSGVQQVHDASKFYLSEEATSSFDNRIRRMFDISFSVTTLLTRDTLIFSDILSHQNSFMGSKPWCELEEVIYA